QQVADVVPGYLRAQSADGLTVGAAHLGPLSGRWVSVLFYPVKNPRGQIAGLISLPVNLQALGERFLGAVAPTDLVVVIDQAGRVIMRSRDSAAWIGKPVPEAQRLGATGAAGRAFMAPGLDGVARFFVAASVAGADWRVLAGVPVDQVLAAPDRALGVGLLLVLGGLAVALAVAWRVSLALVRPIEALSHVATQVAYGQTALRVPPQQGPRELAEVAQTFNRMLDAREQAQQSLSASEERFRTLTALSSDWYWEQDAQHRFIRVDGQPGRRSGPLLSDYVGKTRWEFPAPNLTDADWDRHRAALQAHQAFRGFEIQRLDDNGQLHWVTISGTPMHDAAGQFCGYRGVGSDITERKQQEQRRLSLSARIEELSRGLVQAQEEARRRFSGELHDRTSPNLAALRINLDMIAAATPQARLTDAYAHRIEDTRALIDDTTASIREICAGLHPVALEAGGLLAAVRSFAHQLASRTGLRVSIDCPHGDIRLAPQLGLALFRIVQEAMTNCAKHARAKVVVVKLQFANDPMQVSVTDDGVGFDADRVLQRATRVGLGLLNMRETAEFVGGRLRIESVPGGGTQVTVQIDAQQSGRDP
ncbi:ATP-binding protein, partial [Rhodoferax sp.]|uniref:ATP-binding protein n=1 Tax=Rhodoferax sp. TaxID=50421 RepID=UPI0027695FDE|nr:PAS domain S-box protein [Rhodoferax sp.]